MRIGGRRVLSGSNKRPIFVALGTATILTLSAVAVPAFAADPSPMASEDPAPDPSDSPPATDPPTSPPPDSPPPADPVPSLTVRLSLSATTAAPGGSVTATADVSAQRAVAHHAVVRFSASSASVGGSISLGDLDDSGRSASSVVRIPAGHGSGSVTVTASLSADKASTRSAGGKITVTATGGGSGGGSATANTPGGDLPLSPSVPIPGMPESAAVLGGPAQAQLPWIAQQPATAPGRQPAARPVSLRMNMSPLGLDTTSYRLFWTQVAWLTALLVGVSLLLTQLRLNRARLVARAAVRGSRKGPRGR